MHEAIPAGWQRATFGAVLTRRLETAKGDEELLSVVADRGVVPQGLTGRRNISSADKSAYLKVYQGDIVYNTMRMWQGVSGCSAYHGIVSPAYTVCSPVEGVDGNFMAKMIRHPSYVAQFRRLAQGLTSDVWNLRYSTFATIPLLLPPSHEQRRIAEILDAMDDRMRVTQLAIEKGEIIEETISVPVVDSSWQWLPLGEIATVAAGLTLGAEPSGPSSIALPYLRVANVQDGLIDTSEMKTVQVFKAEVDRYAVRLGDVLLTEGGDFDKLGRGAVWDGRIEPCLHQNHIFRVRCRRDLIIPSYLALYTASPLGRRYFLSVAKQTTNLASINSTQLRSMPVPVPPLHEQERLLRVVSNARSALTAQRAEQDKLRLVKKGLMDDLLTGKVRVGKA